MNALGGRVVLGIPLAVVGLRCGSICPLSLSLAPDKPFTLKCKYRPAALMQGLGSFSFLRVPNDSEYSHQAAPSYQPRPTPCRPPRWPALSAPTSSTLRALSVTSASPARRRFTTPKYLRLAPHSFLSHPACPVSPVGSVPPPSLQASRGVHGHRGGHPPAPIRPAPAGHAGTVRRLASVGRVRVHRAARVGRLELPRRLVSVPVSACLMQSIFHLKIRPSSPPDPQ